MNKKITIIIALLFMVSTFATSVYVGNAALDNISVGDTLYYKVSKYNVRLSDLIDPSTSNVDLSKVVLDLSGSTIGLKIMNKFSSQGYYELNSFIILGKSVVIPLPDTTPATVTDIFGQEINIPAGIGVSLGVTIPGSNFATFLGSNPTNQYPGLPVYLEPTRTADYKALLDNISTNLPVGQTLTTTDGSDTFTTVFQATNGSQQISFTANWFKTGNNAGIFKNLDASATVKNWNGTLINLGINFSFDHKENKPLPANIAVGQTTILSVEHTDLYVKHTGNLFSQTNDTAVKQIQNDLAKYNGQQLVRFTIKDISGLYYKTQISVKDINSNSFNDLGTVWYNGFTGQFTNYDPSCQSVDVSCNSGVTDVIPIAFMPLGAPGITPDWTVWQANYKTVSALANIFTSTLTSGSTKSSLLDFGATINSMQQTTDFRQSGNFNYFYSDFSTSILYDSSQALTKNRPSYFTGQETGNLSLSSNFWDSYDNTGISAGYGLQFNLSLGLSNIPVSATNSTRLSGKLDLGFNVKIKNDQFNSVPDGSKATIVGGSGLIPGVSPGFEALPVLAVLIVIPLITKFKRVNK